MEKLKEKSYLINRILSFKINKNVDSNGKIRIIVVYNLALLFIVTGFYKLIPFKLQFFP